MGRTEISKDVFFGVAAFLSTDDHDFMISEGGKSADHGSIFCKKPISMQFAKTYEGGHQVIHCKRSFWMTRNFDPVPGAEVGKNLALGLFDFLFYESNFIFKANFQGMFFRMFL